MDKDRSQGTGKKITGKIREVVGRLTGDNRQKRAGRAERAEGKVQDTVGKGKDKLRDKL